MSARLWTATNLIYIINRQHTWLHTLAVPYEAMNHFSNKVISTSRGAQSAIRTFLIALIGSDCWTELNLSQTTSNNCFFHYIIKRLVKNIGILQDGLYLETQCGKITANFSDKSYLLRFRSAVYVAHCWFFVHIYWHHPLYDDNDDSDDDCDDDGYCYYYYYYHHLLLKDNK